MLVSIPLAFFVNAFVARRLGPEGFGKLAVLTTSMALAMMITDLGAPWALTQFAAAAHARGEWRVSRELQGKLLAVRLLVQVPVMVVAGAFFLGAVPSRLLLFAVLAVATAVLSAASFSLIIQNRTATQAWIGIVGNVLIQGAVLAAVLRTHLPADVWLARYAVGLCIPAMALGALAGWERRGVVTPRLPRGFPAGFWAFALQMGFAGMLNSLVLTRSEIFVLQVDKQEVALGIFAVAFGLSQWITAPVEAMLGPLLPAAAAVVHAHPQYARAALLRALRYSAVFGGLVNAAVIPTMFVLIPHIYSRRFSGAAILFVPLA
ncbi:MAG: oligosaccharide flippase family protein, partial [Actinomycetota bacterium]|nr:oligosaccharide flippase family protein [Actinomycetota bacterium]